MALFEFGRTYEEAQQNQNRLRHHFETLLQRQETRREGSNDGKRGEEGADLLITNDDENTNEDENAHVVPQ